MSTPARWRRRPLLCLLLLLLIGPTTGATATDPPLPTNSRQEHWLFIGNSLIQKHEVQDLVAGIARSIDGVTPRVERSTLGGATLKSHLERRDAGAPLPRIVAERFHVVVIQPNGRLAMTERPHGLEPYALRPARTLIEAVRSRGGRPIVMMTWAYRGKEVTFPGLRRNFATIGAELSVEVAPVGEAFEVARRQLPEIELLQTDGIHATLAGAYLEASVLYATIQRRSPVDASPPPGLEVEEARDLQELAWRVVSAFGK